MRNRLANCHYIGANCRNCRSSRTCLDFGHQLRMLGGRMAAFPVAVRGAIPARFTIRRTTWAAAIAAIALFACLAAVLGFAAGAHHQPGMTVLKGVAYVGLDEASV